MLTVRPDLVNMADAVDEKDYETFFEYRMDQYSKSGLLAEKQLKPKQDFGEKIFAMVVDNLASMVEDALRENSSKKQKERELNSWGLSN